MGWCLAGSAQSQLGIARKLDKLGEIGKHGALYRMALATADPNEMSVAIEDVLLAIRAELGHSSNHKRRAIRQLFINYVDKLFPED